MRSKKKIILFLTLFALGHISLYYVFYEEADKKNPLVKQMRDWKENKNPVKLLITGDSHTERSVDATQLDSAFNLAFYGENNMFTYYKLKYCLENNPDRPQYVLLQCDLTTFTRGFNYFRNNAFFYYSLISPHDLKDMGDRPLTEHYRFLKIKMFPYADWQYALNLAGINRAKKGTESFSDLGEDEKMASARNFMQNELMCEGKRENLFFAPSVEYVKKCLELCKEYQIKPIFIKYPITQQLLDVVENEIDSLAMDTRNRLPEMLVRKANLPVLDFEKMFSERADLFFDSHHLNNKGREAFTPILKQRLDSLMRVY